MADIVHPLYPNLTIDSDSGVLAPGGRSYVYTVTRADGSTAKTPGMYINREEMLDATTDLDSTNSAMVQDALSKIPGAERAQSDGGGIVIDTVGPAIQKGALSGFLGAPVDVANAALTGADMIIQGGLAAGRALTGQGFDYRTDRILSSEVPKGGSKYFLRGFQDIGDAVRALDQRLDDKIGTVSEAGFFGTGLGAGTEAYVGNLPADLGITDAVLGFFQFDLTPKEITTAERYVSMIAQIAAAAPMEGAVIANIAARLAKTTPNATRQQVYKAVSEHQMRAPGKAARLETVLGAGAGGGMIASLEALEAVYPEAPEWMKTTIMAGGAILLPIAGMTGARVATDVGFQAPFVRIPLRVVRGAVESLTARGSAKSAARAVQTYGADRRNESGILDSLEQLALAMSEGRNLDPATRIAYTTPQLARNEARILEAKLAETRQDLTLDEVQSQETLIQRLRSFAVFQEGQLKSIVEDSGIGAGTAVDYYARYSDRLLQRRDSIFKAIDSEVLRLDPDRPTGGVTEEQLAPVQKAAYEGAIDVVEKAKVEAIADARERIDDILRQMPEDMSPAEREGFNLWIRTEIETAYNEVNNIESVFWQNIKGLDAPAKGVEGAETPEILIGDVPIAEHFAARIAAFEAGDRESHSKWLWKLSGSEALTEASTRGSGADAKQAQDRAVTVKMRESAVVSSQEEVSRTLGALVKAQADTTEPAQIRTARARLAELERGKKAASDGFYQDPSTTTPKKLQEAIDAVDRQQAKLDSLLENSPTDTSEVKKAQRAWDAATKRLNDAERLAEQARGRLEISLEGTLDDAGMPVVLADQVGRTGELSAKVVDGVAQARTGQEVQNIISLLKREMAFEQGRPQRNARKIQNIGEMIDDLQGALADSRNFDVDIPALNAARAVSFLKKEAFERGNIGKLRAFTRGSEAKVDVEQTINEVFGAPGDSATSQSRQTANLRQLETALTPLAANDVSTPLRSSVREDGSLDYSIDPDFDLRNFGDVPAPFETKRVNEGRSLSLTVREGTPSTEANIKLVRETLWDRFRGFRNNETGVFDNAAAERWLGNNAGAIRWLSEATGRDTGFENLVNAEQIVRSIASASAAKIDDAVLDINAAGGFRDGFTEEGFRRLIADADRRSSNLKAASEILDNADPIKLGRNFLKEYNKEGSNSQELLRETLRILENGRLEDGSNPALDGFKQAVGEELLSMGQTQGSEALKLGYYRGDNTIRLWDPLKLAALSDPSTAEGKNFNRLLGEVFGPQAPEVFRKIAEGAVNQFDFNQSTKAIPVSRNKLSEEWAGNLGRVIGGLLAKSALVPVSGLVMTGLGRRYGVNMLANVRGDAVKRMIVELLMNPDLHAAAVKQYPISAPGSDLKLLKRLKMLASKWAQDRFVNDNTKRLDRLRRAPGTQFEILDQDDKAETLGLRRPDQRPSVQPVAPAPPVQRRLAPVNTQAPPFIVPGSVLNQVNPLGGAPVQQAALAAQGPGSPQVAEQGRSIFGMNDPVFAARGGHITGIMAVKPKPRQMVG
jgi:hypothetical protein